MVSLILFLLLIRFYSESIEVRLYLGMSDDRSRQRLFSPQQRVTFFLITVCYWSYYLSLLFIMNHQIAFCLIIKCN